MDPAGAHPRRVRLDEESVSAPYTFCVARRYQKQLSDLPEVEVPDWVLLEKLDALVGPYRDPRSGLQLKYEAKDSRGFYSAESLKQLHSEVEKQEESPHLVIVDLWGGEVRVAVTMSRSKGSDALVHSDDEAFVNHVSTRIRELFAKAAIPTTAPTPEPTPAPALPTRSQDQLPVRPSQPPQQSSFWKQHGTPSLISIFTGLIVTVGGGAILIWLLGN